MPVNKEELVRQLSQKVDASWDAYVEELLQLSPSVLISLADEIAAASFCCDQLKCDSYPDSLLEHLLRFDDPLTAVRDQWMEDRPDYAEGFEQTLWDLQEFGPEPENDPAQDSMEMG